VCANLVANLCAGMRHTRILAGLLLVLERTRQPRQNPSSTALRSQFPSVQSESCARVTPQAGSDERKNIRRQPGED
jgi:hypothetical protein